MERPGPRAEELSVTTVQHEAEPKQENDEKYELTAWVAYKLRVIYQLARKGWIFSNQSNNKEISE